MDDDFARRLAALKSGGPTTPKKTPADDDELTRRFERAFSHSPGARGKSLLPEKQLTLKNPEDDQSIEELIGAVKNEQKSGEWDITADDEKTIEELLEEAELLNPSALEALPDFVDAPKNGVEKDQGAKSRGTGEAPKQDVPDWLRDDTLEEPKSDVDEEEAIIRRIQDELSLEVPHDLKDGQDDDGSGEDGDQKAGNEEADVSDLADRFAALGGLELPTVPKIQPGIKPKPTFKVAPEDGAVDETETWCCICNEDAEYRCSGCDNDIYCGECLFESHTGPNAGYEEKRHKWTKYIRPKKVLMGA